MRVVQSTTEFINLLRNVYYAEMRSKRNLKREREMHQISRALIFPVMAIFLFFKGFLCRCESSLNIEFIVFDSVLGGDEFTHFQ